MDIVPGRKTKIISDAICLHNPPVIRQFDNDYRLIYNISPLPPLTTASALPCAPWLGLRDKQNLSGRPGLRAVESGDNFIYDYDLAHPRS